MFTWPECLLRRSSNWTSIGDQTKPDENMLNCTFFFQKIVKILAIFEFSIDTSPNIERVLPLAVQTTTVGIETFFIFILHTIGKSVNNKYE